MKKVFLFAVAITAISFVSCSGKGNTDSATSNDSVSTTIEEVEAIIPDSTDSATIIVDEIAVETPAK